MTTTTVHVRDSHIRAGVTCDTHRCAVARAMAEATGDTNAQVMEDASVMRLYVNGLSVAAPQEVRQFVWAFDDGAEVGPFTFELPTDADESWQADCYRCSELCDPADLDGEGNCPECRGEG